MNLETFVAKCQAAQASVDAIINVAPESRYKNIVVSINPTPFLNRAHVRKFLLEQSARTRAHKYTRVSEQTLIELNEHVRQWCVTRVARLPSKGRTI